MHERNQPVESSENIPHFHLVTYFLLSGCQIVLTCKFVDRQCFSLQILCTSINCSKEIQSMFSFSLHPGKVVILMDFVTQ